jgi:hypothetical protein
LASSHAWRQLSWQPWVVIDFKSPSPAALASRHLGVLLACNAR